MVDMLVVLCILLPMDSITVNKDSTAEDITNYFMSGECYSLNKLVDACRDWIKAGRDIKRTKSGIGWNQSLAKKFGGVSGIDRSIQASLNGGDQWFGIAYVIVYPNSPTSLCISVDLDDHTDGIKVIIDL